VRVANANEPSQLDWTARQRGKPWRERWLDRWDHVEDDTFVVRRARKAFEVRVGDHAIADSLACTPRKDVAELRDPRLREVHLADRPGPPRKDRTARG
jgi:hypothetical protein